jgi:hypothetical protein
MIESVHVTERLLEVPYKQEHGKNIIVKRTLLPQRRDSYEVLWDAKYFDDDDKLYAALFMRMEFTGMYVATTKCSDMNLIINTLTNGFTSLAEDFESDPRLHEHPIDWDNTRSWTISAWAVTTTPCEGGYIVAIEGYELKSGGILHHLRQLGHFRAPELTF